MHVQISTGAAWGTAWAESVDGIRRIPPVQPGGTAWAESADRIRAIPPVMPGAGWNGAGVRGLPPVEPGGGWDSIPASGGVAAWRHGSRKSAVAAYSQ